ncbi:MAG: LysR substrate-binding domain-containing protein, partial [Yoonia sp.]|uniref:LysR substrate-binding domain-containing protein n=1 Tax=Yoonia sp. TaxID=2212373 RepID=UPI003EF815BA
MRLYASPAYLEKNGILEDIEEISNHRLICQNPNAFQVAAGATLVQHLLSYDKPRILHVNNYFGVMQAVLSNLGIGVLPDYVVEGHNDLVRVLPEVESGEVPVFLAYPEELRQSKRITVFRDFVQEEILADRRRRRAGEEQNA